MKGWFDAFRTDGGPTLYAYSNRTSVTGDVPTIIIFLTFLTIFFAFIIIFPGIRKERFSTFCTVTLSLLTGIIISACNFSSDWEVGSGEIFSSYRAFSAQKIKASLGVSIGLDHANITLKVIPIDNRTLDIDFNERFYWITPDDMHRHYHTSLQKGLPYPILTAAEYLTLDEEGFMWGRAYRNAGYYTSIILWASFACWILSNILLLNVPRYGAYALSATGFMMVFATVAYWYLKPQMPLIMRFENTVITFKSGRCFWITLIVGSMVGISGFIISIIDWIFPHKFSTVLEIDFDTPYDRHIIIEDSLDTRKKKFKIPKLEEPLNVGRTVGSRLLRRLSNRGKEHKERIETNPGIDNAAFELETSHSKASWKSNFLIRSDSKISNKSVNFNNSFHKNSNGIPDVHDTSVGEEISKTLFRSSSKQSISSNSPTVKSFDFEEDIISKSCIPSMKRQDSCQSSSSTSSYGLGMLNGGFNVRKNSNEENPHQPVARNNSGNIIVFHRTDSRGQLQRLSGEVVEIQTDGTCSEW